MDVIVCIMRDEKQLAAIMLKAAKSIFTIDEAYQKRAEAITVDNVQSTATLFEPL